MRHAVSPSAKSSTSIVSRKSSGEVMPEPNNKVLARMLERLFAGLSSGPNLNCRPHSSRQRIDLTHLEKLQDLEPAQILLELLGKERSVKLAAKVPQPKHVLKNSGKNHSSPG